MKKLYLSMWLMAAAVVSYGQCSNPISTFPHVENFETSTAGAPGVLPTGWTITPTTGYRWEIQDGPVTSLDTGPSTDHTTGALGGKYPYTESSSGSTGNQAMLVSPCFNISSLTSPGFEFWYHMNGATMGTLEAQVSADNGATWTTLATYTGAQQVNATAPWLKRTVSLAGYTGNVQVRFRGTRGTSFTSDMAIDDFKIFNIPPNDLELVAITSPAASGCGLTATETVTISIKNNGNSPASGFQVSYQIGAAGSPVTETTPATLVLAPGATAAYNFTTPLNLSVPGTYEIIAKTLMTTDGDPSNNQQTKLITSIPTITTFPYSQNFENGNGGWVSGGANNSWAMGTPAKSVIQGAASGVNAWVTNLTGNYNNSENSFVMGPCFNFAALTGDPDFEMKIWWNSENSWDGAVLQSSINGGTTWQNVGALNDPNNWYNDASINGNPGGQQVGWSGAGTNGSGGWVKAKHKLNGLAGQSSVLLRVAFGSDGSVNSYDGVAFDDIRIGDNTNNLAINSFTPLTQVCGFGANEKVQVEIENLGSVPVNTYTLEFEVDNSGIWNTVNLTTPLLPDTPVLYTFTQGADLSAAGPHTIQVRIANTQGNDPETGNNVIDYNITNALFNTFPINLDFETAQTSVSAARTVIKPKATISEVTGEGNGPGKGLVMAGIDHPDWEVPVGLVNPWGTNADNFAGVYICLGPTNIGNDSLKLTFDLKQYYKTTHYNTNFRVTVNGQQVDVLVDGVKDNTLNPPFGGYGTSPAPWKQIVVDLTPFANKGGIQIGLESSVKEPFAAGAGTANVIDNIQVGRVFIGIKENVLQSNVSVYPNPSTGIFNLNVPTSARSFEIEVTDLTGKLVKRQVVSNNSGESRLDLNGKAQGIYILKITSEGNTATRKLIVE